VRTQFVGLPDPVDADDEPEVTGLPRLHTGQRVLEDRGADYREIELVSAELDDQPGSLGAAARRLAEKGVNIEALIPTGMQGSRVSVAFGVNDGAVAREALGELAGTGTQAV